MNNDVVFNLIAETNKFDSALSASTSQAERLDSALEGASGSSSSLKGNLLTGAVAGAAVAATNKIIGAISSMKDTAMEASDALAGYNYAMGFIGIDEKKIESSKAALKDYALSTTYDMRDVLTTAQVVASAGEKDFDKITKSLGNVVAMGDGATQEFKHVSQALGKINTEGKLTAGSWMFFKSSIPAGANLLADKMKELGMYTGSFSKAMSKGKISAKDFNRALIELGDNQFAEDYAKGITFYSGSMNNLKNSVVTAWLDIEAAIGKTNITSLINDVAGGIGKMGSALVSVVNIVKDNGDWIKPLAISSGVMLASYAGLMKLKSGYTAISSAVKVLTGAQRTQMAMSAKTVTSSKLEQVAMASNLRATQMTTAAKNRNSVIVAANVAASKMEANALNLNAAAQAQYARGAFSAGAATKVQATAMSAGAAITNKSSMALGAAASGATKLASGVLSFLGPMGIATIAIGALTFGMSKWNESQAKAVEGAHDAAETLSGKMSDAVQKAQERYAEAADSISGSLGKISQQQALVGQGVKGFTNKSLVKTILEEYKNISTVLKETLDKQLQDEIEYIQNRKTLSKEDKKSQIKDVTDKFNAEKKQASANQKEIDKISDRIRKNKGKATKEDIKQLEAYVEKAKELSKKITPDAEGKLDKFTAKGATGGKMNDEDRKAFHKALEETYGKELSLIQRNTEARKLSAQTEAERVEIMREGANEQAASLDKMFSKILQANGADKEGISFQMDKNGLLKDYTASTEEQQQAIKEYNEYLKAAGPEAAQAWKDMSGQIFFDQQSQTYYYKGQELTRGMFDGIVDKAATDAPVVNEALKYSVDQGFNISDDTVFYQGVDVTQSWMDGMQSQDPTSAINYIKSQVSSGNMVVDKSGEGGKTVKTYTGGIDAKSNDVKVSAQKAADKAKGVKSPDMKSVGAAIPEGMASGINGSSGLVQSAVSMLVNSIPAAVRKLLGINSPSKVIRGIMVGVGEGGALGIKDSTNLVVKAAVSQATSVVSAIQTTLKKALSSAGLTNVIGTNYIKMLKNAQSMALKGVTDPAQIKAIQEYWGKLIKEAEIENKRNVELAGIDDNFKGQLSKQDSTLSKYTKDQNAAQKKALANSSKLKSLKKQLDKKGLSSAKRKSINAAIKKEEERIKKIYQDRISAKQKQIEANKKLIQQRYDLAKANAKNKHEVEDLQKQMQKELEDAENSNDLENARLSYFKNSGGQTQSSNGDTNNTVIEQVVFDLTGFSADEVGDLILDKMNELTGNNVRNGVQYRK